MMATPASGAEAACLDALERALGGETPPDLGPLPRDRARRRAARAGEAPRRRCRAAPSRARRPGTVQGAPEGGQARHLPAGAGRHRGAARAGARAARDRPAAGARGARLAVRHRRQRLARRVDPLRGRARRRAVAVLADPERRVGHPRGGGRPDHAQAPRARARLAARAPEAPLGGQRSRPRGPARRGGARICTRGSAPSRPRTSPAGAGSSRRPLLRRSADPPSPAPAEIDGALLDRSAELADLPGARRMVRRARARPGGRPRPPPGAREPPHRVRPDQGGAGGGDHRGRHRSRSSRPMRDGGGPIASARWR